MGVVGMPLGTRACPRHAAGDITPRGRGRAPIFINHIKNYFIFERFLLNRR